MSGTKIFVGNLPHGTKPEKLRHLFEQYGVVVECDVMTHCGFIHMQTPAMAETAVDALNGVNFRGQNIAVERGRPKDSRGGGMGRGGGRGGGGGRSGDGHGGSSRFNYSQSNGSGPIRSDNFRSQRSGPYSSRGGRGGGGSFRGRGGSSNQLNNGGERFQNNGRYSDRPGGEPRRDRSFSASSAPPRNRDNNSFGGNNRFRNAESRNYGESKYGSGQGSGFSNDRISNGNFDRNNSSGGQDRRGFALPSAGRESFRGGFGTSDSFQRRNSIPEMDYGGRGRRGGGGYAGGNRNERDNSFRRNSNFGGPSNSGTRDFYRDMRNDGAAGGSGGGLAGRGGGGGLGGRGGGRGGMHRHGPPRENMMSRR